MTTAVAPALRIGELARLVGTTPRTIRYYEEIGLLTGATRAAGSHRLYTEVDVERLRELVRLKDLLGVSLDELKELAEAAEARTVLRREWHEEHPDPARRREILDQALGHLDKQLDLVSRRRADIDRLEAELKERRRKLRRRVRELDG
jgi:DNA-binding transcriptional MerR regulator